MELEPKVDEPKVTEEPKVEAPKYTEIESKAMNMGWKPKEQWEGPEEEFTDAGEFVRRQPLFAKIEYQNKKIKSVETALNQLVEHHSKVRQMEYERALKELKSYRKEALKDGDTDQALEFEEQIEQLQEEHQKAPPVVAPQKGPSEEFLQWVQTNQWYMKDQDMHDFADGVAMAFIKRNEATGNNVSESEIFKHVVSQVRRAYPDQFGNPNRDRPSPVSSGDRNGRATKSTFKLTPEQEDVARSFERNGVMTREKYIAELKKTLGEE